MQPIVERTVLTPQGLLTFQDVPEAGVNELLRQEIQQIEEGIAARSGHKVHYFYRRENETCPCCGQTVPNGAKLFTVTLAYAEVKPGTVLVTPAVYSADDLNSKISGRVKALRRLKDAVAYWEGTGGRETTPLGDENHGPKEIFWLIKGELVAVSNTEIMYTRYQGRKLRNVTETINALKEMLTRAAQKMAEASA